jgi:hypothetical protein
MVEGLNQGKESLLNSLARLPLEIESVLPHIEGETLKLDGLLSELENQQELKDKIKSIIE